MTSWFGLEGESQTKVQLPHGWFARSVRRSRAGNNTAAAAVYAIVRLTQVDVVEGIECLETELSFNSLRNRKVLKERDIGVEETRSSESVSPAPELGDTGTKERATDVAIGR